MSENVKASEIDKLKLEALELGGELHKAMLAKLEAMEHERDYYSLEQAINAAAYAQCFFGAGRKAYEAWEPARAELASLRAKAERAGDCEAIVRLQCTSGARVVLCIPRGHPKCGRWHLERWGLPRNEHIDTGPIVAGLPVLTDTARAAIEGALKQ